MTDTKAVASVWPVPFDQSLMPAVHLDAARAALNQRKQDLHLATLHIDASLRKNAILWLGLTTSLWLGLTEIF